MATKEAKKASTDPELLAMSRITRVLSGLDELARSRVLDWLNARHVKPTGNGMIPFGGKEDAD